MQRNIVETIMGAVVLLVAALFAVFFARTADVSPTGGYELSAKFNKIDGLDVGAPVRLSGIKVGSITGFDLDEKTYQAIVRMNIREDIKLPADTAAIVSSAGLLDGKFMTLQPGGEEEVLEPGDTIAYTQSTPSLEQLLGQVIFSLNKQANENTGDGKPAADTAAP